MIFWKKIFFELVIRINACNFTVIESANFYTCLFYWHFFLLFCLLIKFNWKYNYWGNPNLFKPLSLLVCKERVHRCFCNLVFVSYLDENFTRCTAIKPRQAALSKMYIFCLKFKFTKFGALVKKNKHISDTSTSTFSSQFPLHRILQNRVFWKNMTDEWKLKKNTLK